MDMLSALRAKAEQAEVYLVESESTEVSFEANEMKSATAEQTQGVALRALVDGRLGFAAAAGRVVESELVSDVLASAQYGDELAIDFPGSATGPEVVAYDPDLEKVPVARFVEIGREIISALRQVDEDAHIDVSIERGVGTSTLRNSAGAEVTQRGSSFSIGVSVQRVRGDDVFMTYDSVQDIGMTDAYRGSIDRLADQMETAKRSATLTSGRMPVLFSPRGAFVLVLPIMMGVNGESVQRGTSPLSTKLGKQAFDAKLTLWDDPTIPGRPGSSSHDDEGVPCRRKAMISQGVCRTFLYDLKTASLMGTESTGNGGRSLFSMPSPSASNLVVEAGDTPMAQLLSGIDHGLLVERVLGLGQGNAISGAFSNTVGLAYAIEGGEIVGRVKDVSIAGNIYDVLKDVAAISQETHWVYGRYRMPYILLPAVNVVSKS
jgi:PmbA protein